jgi:hypothetical protein
MYDKMCGILAEEARKKRAVLAHLLLNKNPAESKGLSGASGQTVFTQ